MAAPQITRITPRRGWRSLALGEVWQARLILWLLLLREVRVRYKQTVIGAGWALFQPTLMTVVFSFVLGGLAAQSGSAVPYALHVYCGMLGWIFFATAITNAGSSIVAVEQVVTKVWFPRLVIPFAAVGAAGLDLAVAAGGLALLMAWFGWVPTASLLLAPLVLLLIGLLALGAGAALSALMVSYRDVRYLLPFLVQVLLFATPSIYLPAGTGPGAGLAGAVGAGAEAAGGGALRPSAGLLAFHPLDGLIDALRSCLLGLPLDLPRLAYGASFAIVAFFLGALLFRRLEDEFADLL